ncbi:flagellar hook-length control protein FliK [Halomonas ventosae]|uniref:Flagellar hook-length control protein FliK n=1 Tax=Halomonas ventosae TaxID=229007 RepID=A0A4R6ZTP1_9GAMM|nr:flagellar hook-length control protein FliK [Halomonas ventosae]TDR56110.1 flagellar hook-length control protein FliK [Halomonas ventosae]
MIKLTPLAQMLSANPGKVAGQPARGEASGSFAEVFQQLRPLGGAAGEQAAEPPLQRLAGRLAALPTTSAVDMSATPTGHPMLDPGSVADSLDEPALETDWAPESLMPLPAPEQGGPTGVTEDIRHLASMKNLAEQNAGTEAAQAGFQVAVASGLAGELGGASATKALHDTQKTSAAGGLPNSLQAPGSDAAPLLNQLLEHRQMAEGMSVPRGERVDAVPSSVASLASGVSPEASPLRSFEAIVSAQSSAGVGTEGATTSASPLMGAQSSALHSSSPAAGAPQPAGGWLSATVASPEWEQQLGQQVVQMTRHGQQSMELSLHPAELGPLTVSLKVAEQGAQAHFLAANAQVRQALEMALPQLREALAEQGIQLGEASVGEQGQAFAGQQEHHPGRAGIASAGSAGGSAESGMEPLAQPTTVVRLDGKVDLYA